MTWPSQPLAIFLLGRRRQSFPWWSLVAIIPLLAGGIWGLILAIITGRIAAAQNAPVCSLGYTLPSFAAVLDAEYNQLVGYQAIVTHTIQATVILFAVGLVALLWLGTGMLRTRGTRQQVA